jgi:Uma2 family endonuclease
MTDNAIPAVLDPDDLLEMPDGGGYELIDGRLQEKSMGARSDRIALRLGGRMDQFCLQTKCGLVFGSQTGFRCFPKWPKLVRKPDVSFVAAGRLPNDQPPDGDVDLAPDLAVEVISPNETYEEVEAKVASTGRRG